MLPSDKTVRCHETGFKKSCFDMVNKYKCRKWVHFTGPHPQTRAIIDQWDCRDHLEHLFWMQAMQAQMHTTASVDKLANEVQKANDGGVANALLGLNREMRRQTELISSDAPAASKLIEN